MWTYSREITSPISGLLIGSREEDGLSFINGLQYQWSKERILPIILTPNDEPKPDNYNFYNYDSLANQLLNYFYLLPVRRNSKLNPERLKTIINDSDTPEIYEGYINQLKKRNNEDFKKYKIREITKDDTELISNIQYLRGNDILLREKLVHISREFDISI